MKNLSRFSPALFFFVLLILGAVSPDILRAGTAKESPRKTVDRLYKFVFENDQNPRARELPDIKEDFDPKFYKSLMTAFNLPEAGLDFAPFIAAQDLVGPYRVGTPVVEENEALVPVTFGARPNPSVQIKLRMAGEKWLVEDIMYPGDKEPNNQLSNILTLLLTPDK